jgi:hypothetical protein
LNWGCVQEKKTEINHLIRLGNTFSNWAAWFSQIPPLKSKSDVLAKHRSVS